MAGHDMPPARAIPAALLSSLLLPVMLLSAGPALAVGAQGVDLQPLLDRRDGVLTADVLQDGTPVGLLLHNQAEEPRTVTVTARVVERSAAGDPVLGAAADWITIDDARAITLGPGEERRLEGRVALAGYRDARTDSVAFVLAIEGGGNVVAQAATIVRLTDGGAQLPLPVGLLLLATALLALVGTAWVRIVRRHGLRPSPVPA